MWGKLLCFFGWHRWKLYESTAWGETAHYRRCERPGCRVRQRWHEGHGLMGQEDYGHWL